MAIRGIARIEGGRPFWIFDRLTSFEASALIRFAGRLVLVDMDGNFLRIYLVSSGAGPRGKKP